MKDHYGVLDYTKQVIALQTQVAWLVEERDVLRAEIVDLQRWKDRALANHAIIEELQTGNERLRNGLRAVGVIVAGLSMTDVNMTRADMARIENYIAGVLNRGYEPPTVSYETKLEVRAGSPLSLNGGLGILEVLE